MTRPPRSRLAMWAYLRLSPGEKQSVASQRTQLERFARERGLLVARWWIDDGLSGSSVDGREAFDGMMEASRVKPSPVAGVLLWNLSRWGRNDLESQYYRSDIRLRGYAVVSVADEIPGAARPSSSRPSSTGRTASSWRTSASTHGEVRARW